MSGVSDTRSQVHAPFHTRRGGHSSLVVPDPVLARTLRVRLGAYVVCTTQHRQRTEVKKCHRTQLPDSVPLCDVTPPSVEVGLPAPTITAHVSARARSSRKRNGLGRRCRRKRPHHAELEQPRIYNVKMFLAKGAMTSPP